MSSNCDGGNCGRSPAPGEQTLSCPPELQKFYCLNDSKCFVVKIEDAMIYNCECNQGFLGQRCEFKDLDQSYFRQRYNAMIQQASLTAAFVVLMVLIIIFILFLYTRRNRRQKNNQRTRFTGDEFMEIDSSSTQGKEDLVSLPFNNRIV